MSTLLLVAMALAASGTSHADLSPNPTGPKLTKVTPVPLRRDIEGENRQALRRLKTEDAAKIVAAMKDDPRVPPVRKDLVALGSITDPGQLKIQGSALKGRLEALQADAIKRAGIDLRVSAEKLRAGRARLAPPIFSFPKEPPSPIATQELTSFTETDTRRVDCPDVQDTWSFSGGAMKVAASKTQTWGDSDCAILGARKGAKVQVPAAARSMRVRMKGSVKMSVLAASFGISSEAWAAVGARIESPTGVALTKSEVPGIGEASLPYAWCDVKQIAAKPGGGVGPLTQLDSADFNAEVAFDDAWCSFPLPPNAGQIVVHSTVGAGVDADENAMARASAQIDLRAIQVVFYP